jgi:hypothetical protein
MFAISVNIAGEALVKILELIRHNGCQLKKDLPSLQTWVML